MNALLLVEAFVSVVRGRLVKHMLTSSAPGPKLPPKAWVCAMGKLSPLFKCFVAVVYLDGSLCSHNVEQF